MNLPQNNSAFRPQGATNGNQQVAGQMMGNVPYFRARAESVSSNLPATVDSCLSTYFKELNGMSPAPGMYDKVISQVEKPLIEHVLKYVRGNQVRAAAILGINRNTLRKKINLLAIDINGLLREVAN